MITIIAVALLIYLMLGMLIASTIFRFARDVGEEEDLSGNLVYTLVTVLWPAAVLLVVGGMVARLVEIWGRR